MAEPDTVLETEDDPLPVVELDAVPERDADDDALPVAEPDTVLEREDDPVPVVELNAVPERDADDDVLPVAELDAMRDCDAEPLLLAELDVVPDSEDNAVAEALGDGELVHVGAVLTVELSLRDDDSVAAQTLTLGDTITDAAGVVLSVDAAEME